MSVSNVQFAAQPSPPKVLQRTHSAPGQSVSLSQAVPILTPSVQIPCPVHCDSEVQWVPALVPPVHVPPSSHSSLTLGSTEPFPHTPLTGVGVAVGVGVAGGNVLVGVPPGGGVTIRHVSPRNAFDAACTSAMVTCPSPLRSQFWQVDRA